MTMAEALKEADKLLTERLRIADPATIQEVQDRFGGCDQFAMVAYGLQKRTELARELMVETNNKENTRG